ncbi:hypothetical protein [Nostoc foliaceum]|uniref:Transposase n=1 Tax=Nostoc linckia FACHB-391 TaxID=2692906 RepID=A0ABR8F341_NOSLI|nr:hypothetical protein [Nostoc foliaceum]MBD2563484.1 hypothetical protein [Nostoc linckia FACHB-391]
MELTSGCRLTLHPITDFLWVLVSTLGYYQSLRNELVSCVLLILPRLYFTKPPIFQNEIYSLALFFIQKYVLSWYQYGSVKGYWQKFWVFETR